MGQGWLPQEAIPGGGGSEPGGEYVSSPTVEPEGKSRLSSDLFIPKAVGRSHSCDQTAGSTSEVWVCAPALVETRAEDLSFQGKEGHGLLGMCEKEKEPCF